MVVLEIAEHASSVLNVQAALHAASVVSFDPFHELVVPNVLFPKPFGFDDIFRLEFELFFGFRAVTQRANEVAFGYLQVALDTAQRGDLVHLCSRIPVVELHTPWDGFATVDARFGGVFVCINTSLFPLCGSRKMIRSTIRAGLKQLEPLCRHKVADR